MLVLVGHKLMTDMLLSKDKDDTVGQHCRQFKHIHATRFLDVVF